jgi:AcrR family transcriptional regulator
MPNGSSSQPADETRARLFEAATVIFSELGYQGATTRMICERAQANPAAVNYHFGDKLGLYTAVLEVGDEKSQFNALHLLEMEPEAALKAFISGLLESLDGKEHHVRIMSHELSQPTPALATVVEQIIRPQSRVLCEIVGRITGRRPEAREVELASQSIIAQVVHYVNARPILDLMWPDRVASNEEIVAHVSKFSMLGLRAL